MRFVLDEIPLPAELFLNKKKGAPKFKQQVDPVNRSIGRLFHVYVCVCLYSLDHLDGCVCLSYCKTYISSYKLCFSSSGSDGGCSPLSLICETCWQNGSLARSNSDDKAQQKPHWKYPFRSTLTTSEYFEICLFGEFFGAQEIHSNLRINFERQINKVGIQMPCKAPLLLES